jgi:hypothetical protein
MLILEKIINKYHQIWIMVDGEKRNTKFDCRLKGEKQTVLHLAPPLHCRRVVVNHRIICTSELF